MLDHGAGESLRRPHPRIVTQSAGPLPREHQSHAGAALLHIDAEQVNAALDWASLIAAMRAAHRSAVRPHIADLLLAPSGR